MRVCSDASKRQSLGRWLLRAGLVFILLIVTYASGRVIHVAMGSWYDGVRSPYLQALAATSVCIRWQTMDEQLGEVRYGESLDRLEYVASGTSAGRAHEVRITDLKPDTRYYYSVGTKAKVLYGGDMDHWFVTAPKPGQSKPTRIWVIGDSGQVGQGQLAVRDSMLHWISLHPRDNLPYLDLWLTTGDNAYRSGTNEQFQQALFEPFAELLKNLSIWPAYGNHDARRWVFFDIFTLPEKGEVGGTPSGTENYFSFEYSNIHFVFLDSQGTSLDKNSAMLQWLEKDLSATHQQWLIAVMHHPPYSRGTHNSDNSKDSGGRLKRVRENVLPLLEKAGVDLVLTGHSHMYERSYLLDCHYGDSKSLQAWMIVDKGSRLENQEIYHKPTKHLASHKGAIYAVVGSSSKVDNGPLDHPVMAISLRELGSLLIDISGDRLNARFINDKSQVRDSFTITKGATAVSAPAHHCSY